MNRLTGCILAGIVLAPFTFAQAPPKPPAPPRIRIEERGADSYSRGTRALDERKYEDAIQQFDRVINQADNRVVIARWFEQHVPPGSSILQSGSHYGHAQFDQKLGYTPWRWDGGQGIFLVNNRPAKGRPDWILLQDSPLPSETQAVVKQFLSEDYVLVHDFHALSNDSSHVFDRQDAFFVPYAGFDQVTRPGPNFSLFRRANAPAL